MNFVNIKNLHEWIVPIQQAIEIQYKLASQVICRDIINDVRFIGGVDISVKKGIKVATAAIVILEYPGLKLVDSITVQNEVRFPYIPGLLSFREIPVLLPAFKQLSIQPDLILVDGQGIAHPRRIGLASHLGLFLNIPTIGCAKSRLCGNHTDVPDAAGSYSMLTDEEEIIGVVLRTKVNTKPIYVSVGHKISLNSAVKWVIDCCKGYRLPEPTRLAHMAANGHLYS
ncbi:MAG: deoxyribonuclease V [Chloroflexi bacterium]|nr:deoxyribonuclease V [Chloroflexota bacterium]